MKPSFVIDEDLHKSIASVFKELGLDVFDVRDMGLRGKPDREIFQWAQKKNAVLVSGDLGFANIVEFPRHKGMIILRFPNEMPTDVINKELKRLLKDIAEKDYKNNLIIVRPGGIRIKRLD